MNSITRKVTSPQFMIQFSNGSTIRFFTSGMRSGGKSDVARGQEAHLIILDEMDYMHADDLDDMHELQPIEGLPNGKGKKTVVQLVERLGARAGDRFGHAWHILSKRWHPGDCWHPE